MTETLRVDTGLVLEAGGRLQGIAGAIPPPPASFSPTGTDALSTAIAGKVAEVVDPVLAQLPIVREDLNRYAQNVVSAANAYDRVDRQIAEEIRDRLEVLEKARRGEGATSGGGGATSAAGGSGASGAARSDAAGSSAAAAAAAPSSGAAQSADGAQQNGDMGQMMQMPMQMAQQAAQMPGQMGGAIGSMTGPLMQGAQSAAQQAVQTAQKSGQENETRGEEERPEDTKGPEIPSDQAAPGASAGERAPEPTQPAPTRRGDSPEIAL